MKERKKGVCSPSADILCNGIMDKFREEKTKIRILMEQYIPSPQVYLYPFIYFNIMLIYYLYYYFST